MKKKKKRHSPKIKKKRNKKYKGALAQSKAAKATTESNYTPAIDFLSGYNANLNTLSNQLSFLTTASSAYQPALLTAVQGFQNQFATLSGINTILPRVDHLTFASPILDLSRQATLAFSSLAIPSTINALSAAVGTNIKPWYDANIATASLISTATTSALAASSGTVELLLGTKNLSTLTIQSGIARATELSMYAEKSLHTITSTNIGSRISLDHDGKNYLTTSFKGLSDSYTTLVKSYEINPISYTEINPCLTKLTSVEYFSSANLLEALSVKEDIIPQEELLKNEIQFENEFSLNEYLPKVGPGLYKMWKGAIEAYHSNNSDRVRHFSASIRELFTHLMQVLAPDSEVRNWTSNSNHFDEKNRPTRKTRLLYICRNISDNTFNNFVKKDVDATMAFVEVLQKGTHSIDPNFTPNNLVTIKSKAESTLKFLLEIHFTANK